MKPKEKCPLLEEKAKVVEKTKIVKQPLILVPLPSPDCAKDWNYNQHGLDWKCRCNEGLEQSPIDLPGKDQSEQIKVNDLFDYNEVRKDEIKFIYEINMVRIVPINDEVNMGQLTDTDGNLYQVTEIQFHTPADHTLLGKKYDLEVQIVHRCIKGDFKNKAVLSILYQKKPGAKVRFFDEVDILNLPNPSQKETEQVYSANFNLWKLLYDGEDLVRPPPFNYYKYHGSFAYPPCEENVVWFVVAQPQNLSMTTITFLKDSVLKPVGGGDCDEESEGDYPDNFDGNNRNTQPLRDRTIFYFDRLESCNPYEPPKRPPKPLGHFEKVEKTASKYYFVQGEQPSGIPGAYVVSEKEARGKLTPQMRINIGNYRETDRYKLHRFQELDKEGKGYI